MTEDQMLAASLLTINEELVKLASKVARLEAKIAKLNGEDIDKLHSQIMKEIE